MTQPHIGVNGAHEDVADSLTTITTDTGAFAPWTGDFTRIVAPGVCIAAAEGARDVARRSLAIQYRLLMLKDTAPERDTLPREAIALAQRCGARFTLANTAPANLPDLMTLALMAGRDTLARASVERRLSLAPTPQARQDVLTDAVSRYLTAEPARLDAAAWAIARADTLALREHTNSLPAHDLRRAVWARAFDRSHMVREASQMISLGRTLDFSVIRYLDLPLIYAWKDILQAAFFDHPDSLDVLAQQAKDDLRRFPPASAFPDGVPYHELQRFDFANANVTMVRRFLIPFDPMNYVDSHALPPVEAPFWFPAKPATWPPRGRVSLVLYGGWTMRCSRSDWNLLLSPMSAVCAPLRTYLREWTQQYDSADFAITVVDRTSGEAVRSVPLPPQVEADTIGWFYRTYLKSPWTVAVVPRAVMWQVPIEADGRRSLGDTTAFGRMLGSQNEFAGLAMVYDRSGTLRYAGDLNNALLHAIIVRALTYTASSTSSDSSSSPAR
jgi:hypothetical protein